MRTCGTAAGRRLLAGLCQVTEYKGVVRAIEQNAATKKVTSAYLNGQERLKFVKNINSLESRRPTSLTNELTQKLVKPTKEQVLQPVVKVLDSVSVVDRQEYQQVLGQYVKHTSVDNLRVAKMDEVYDLVGARGQSSTV